MSYLRITRRTNTSKPQGGASLLVHYTFKIKFCNGVHQLINRQTDEPVYADAKLSSVQSYATKNNFIVVGA